MTSYSNLDRLLRKKSRSLACVAVLLGRLFVSSIWTCEMTGEAPLSFLSTAFSPSATASGAVTFWSCRRLLLPITSCVSCWVVPFPSSRVMLNDRLVPQPSIDLCCALVPINRLRRIMGLLPTLNLGSDW